MAKLLLEKHIPTTYRMRFLNPAQQSTVMYSLISSQSVSQISWPFHAFSVSQSASSVFISSAFM